MKSVQEGNPAGDAIRKLLAAAFAEAPMGIALTTLDGQFLECNAAYCRMVGFTLQELRQPDLLTITHGDDRAGKRERIRAAMACSRGSFNWEERDIRKDGEAVSVRGSVSIIRGEDQQPVHIIGIFEDLSERNAAMEDLRRSQALLEIAGRVAQVGGWSVDLPERRLVWSDVVAAIHDEPAGFSPSLAQGVDYFVPEHRDIMRAAFECCAGNGTPYDLELEKITARGRRIWVRTIGQAERDAQGQVVRVQGAFQEVSSRKHNELAALELAERLRTTLESISDAFCTLDARWCVTYANRQALQLFDPPRESLLGGNLWAAFASSNDSVFEHELQRARARQLPVHFEAFHTRLHKWFAVTAYPSPQGLAIHFRDVSDVRGARQRLELLEASVAQLNDIVLITEADRLDEPGPRIAFVNEAFTRITGHAVADVLGRSPRLMQGALTDRTELARIRTALSRFEPVHSELVNYTKAGVPYWVEMDIVPVGAEGGAPTHFVAIERDITERKRTQHVLLESEERLRLLHDLSEATRTLTGATQIMEAMARLLGQYLRASRCAYAQVDGDGEHFTIVHEYTDGCASAMGNYQLSLFGARAVATLRSGQPLIIGNVDAQLQRSDGADLFSALGVKAIVCCPLVKDGALRAMLTVHQSTPRDWEPREVAKVLEVAERCWAAIERDTSEGKLRKSADLLRIAGHTARLGGWAVDLQDERVNWSDEVRAILEVSAATPPALREAFGFYAPQSIGVIRKAFDMCARQGVSFDLELEMITAKHRPVWVRCTGEAARNATGAVTRVHGALQDITEQKHTEAERERLAVILEATPDLVSISDPAGQLLFLNRAGRDVLGVGLHEPLAHMTIADFVSPAAHPGLAEVIPAAVRQGVWSGETLLLSRAGTAIPVSQVILAHKSPDGTLASVSHVMRDITERKMAEAALRESERRFSDLLRTVQLLSVMLDRDGCITYCNDYLLSLTGWRRDEVVGRNWFELFIAPADSELRESTFPMLLANLPDAWHHENDILTRAGDRRLVRWSNSVLRSAAGAVIGTASIGEDITEAKRDQAALRELNAELEHRVTARTAQLHLAREEADQANHAKSAFLAAMSHEIRTPMNGVIGMIDVLHQTSLKGPQVEMVDLIRDSAFSLLGIIEDILDFSKIEAGRMDLVNESMLLGELIENGCGMLAQMAVKRGVRMTMFIDPTIPRAVRGDKGRVRQVLVNLASNAIKFSSGRLQRGQVSVRAVLVERQAAHVTVDLAIADNGIGMNGATLARLFTPFSQADASTTRRFGGTGLGLAICDMLVRLMGGQISVQSELGYGATFTVRLRFATVEAPPAEEAAGTRVDGLRCRVVGSEQPLADDLGVYLRHGAAIVEHVPDLAAAAATAPAAGLSLWLILPGQPVPPLAGLRAMAPTRPGVQTRFVVLGFGARRRPRVEAPDLVTVDADVLSRRTLFQALALAAGRMQGDAIGHDRVPSDPSAAAPPNPDAKGRRILVAEDNETNRKVILRQLELVGFSAEVCVDGRDALERWRSGTFALVLTDLHMPVMDGYELALAIRGEEDVQRRTPIIALTANALREEEMRCRAAGMDGYLTKPVRLPQLKAAIESWLDPAAHSNAGRPAREPAQTGPPVDLGVLAALVGDDPAVIDEVLQTFRRSALQSSAELDQAFADGSMAGVADAAHKLKSAARAIGGNRLGHLCNAIEDAALARRPQELTPLLPMFHAELRAVFGFLPVR